MKIVVAALTLMMASVAVTATDAASDELPLTAVDLAMRDAGVVGAAMARLEQGRVVETRAFGLREVAGSAVTSATVFQAASLGKIAVAYAAMILVEQGKLTLDQPLTDPRIDVADGCTKPTVRSVLSHTSGMGNDLTASRFAVSCQPGAIFRYSGQGFLALASEMERVTGTPAPALVKQLVFVPLGMNQTRFGPATDGNDVAKGHISLTAYAIGQAVGKPLQGVGLLVNLLLLALLLVPTWLAIRRGWRTGVSGYLSSVTLIGLLILIGLRGQAAAERAQPTEMIPASLTSNITDMGRFAAELLAPQLIPAVSVKPLFAEQVVASSCVGWSLLMGTDRCGKQATAWQWGSNLGFQSLLVLHHESGRGVVILTNSGGGLDTVFPSQGGYTAAKQIVTQLLGVKGRWDLRG